MPERLSAAQAAELLQRPQEHVLCLGLAQRLNTVAKDFPDDQALAPLIKPWFWRAPPPELREAYRGKVEVPTDWFELMNTLESRQVDQFGRFLERSFWAGVRTVGGLRRESAYRGMRRGMGVSVGKPFAFIAFKKAEENPSTS